MASLFAPLVTPQQHSLSDFDRAAGTWSAPRVVATMSSTEHAGGSPSALDLVRTGATTYLASPLWHIDPVTCSTRVVTDVDGVAPVDDLEDGFVDLDARGTHAALLTTPRCQPGGVLSVRTRWAAPPAVHRTADPPALHSDLRAARRRWVAVVMVLPCPSQRPAPSRSTASTVTSSTSRPTSPRAW